MEFSGKIIFKENTLITGSLRAGSIVEEKEPITVRGDYIVHGEATRPQTVLGDQDINKSQGIGK